MLKKYDGVLMSCRSAMCLNTWVYIHFMCTCRFFHRYPELKSVSLKAKGRTL